MDDSWKDTAALAVIGLSMLGLGAPFLFFIVFPIVAGAITIWAIVRLVNRRCVNPPAPNPAGPSDSSRPA
jgi:hypothetical protein